MHALPSLLASQVSSASRHGVARGLQGEVDDGRGSADGCGDGAGAVIVGRNGAAEGHIEMGVNIDAAGHHQQTGGIDHACGPSAGMLGATCGNRLAVDRARRLAAGRPR